MQTVWKGDPGPPRPPNCILRRRSNEENTAATGLVVAAGPGARSHVAKRRSSLGAGEESVRRSFHRNREGRGKPHRKHGGAICQRSITRSRGSVATIRYLCSLLC